MTKKGMASSEVLSEGAMKRWIAISGGVAVKKVK